MLVAHPHREVLLRRLARDVMLGHFGQGKCRLVPGGLIVSELGANLIAFELYQIGGSDEVSVP